MSPSPSRPIDHLANALVAALRRLGESGEPVAASRIAATAWSAVRHDEQRIADRLNGVMHELARLEAAVDASADSPRERP